ncbi:MAG TPA: mechanosensitive ion channel domain-containing protein [Planctomycetota bacterium]|nr:mechanosensitive ion channel domain-containing protein [Planctomycetota bacterium]
MIAWAVRPTDPQEPPSQPPPPGPAAPAGPVKTQEGQSIPGTQIFGYDSGLPAWAAIPLFLLIWGALTYFLIRLLNRHFRRMAAATGNKMIDLVVASQQGTLVVLFMLLGVKILLDSNALEHFREYGSFALVTLVVVTTVLATVRVATTILTELATTKVNFRPLVGPTGFVIKLFVFVIAAILWMEALQIPITSIVMALGIGGLAAGLALQDTLANLFAGIWIILHRLVRVGDFIRLATGEEGFVESIGWRDTGLLTRQNNLLVIPNRRLAEASITNYSLPYGQTVAEIEVTAGMDAAPDRIRDLLREEIRGVQGVLADKEALIRLARMEPSGLTFRLVVAIESVLDRESIESEIREKILLRMRSDGIAPWGDASTRAAAAALERKTTRRRTK